jgi:hypothetical protein
MGIDYFPPSYAATAFQCPFCTVKAKQHWVQLHGGLAALGGSRIVIDVKQIGAAMCEHCSEMTVWVNQQLVYPPATLAPPANPDLPSDARASYDEAAGIAARSPRGAAALLRLSVQQLCIHLGLPGKNLNEDIAALVSQGLNPDVQLALDSLRVVGNNAVHPLEMQLEDDVETASSLFAAVNFIADQMITHRAKVRALFAKLPAGARDAIKKRDG